MLEGKVVLITGAARGIGRTYCTGLYKLGATVIATDLDSCDDTLSEIRDDERATGYAMNVTSAQQAADTVAKIMARFGRLDGLVNNAALYGKLHGGRFDDISEDEWDAAMAVNVKGVWNCCKAAIPAMAKQGAGSIVNVASLAALYGMPYALHYATTKAAVIGLTRSLAREVGRKGIRLNSVAPSIVTTEGTREFFGVKYDVALETIGKNQIIQRNLEADDLVGTVAWLLSDASAFVTGQTIMVDGGTVLL